MAIAWLLTLLGLAGVGTGVLSGSIARVVVGAFAAGGGLLFGISLFWLIPELVHYRPMVGAAAAAAGGGNDGGARPDTAARWPFAPARNHVAVLAAMALT